MKFLIAYLGAGAAFLMLDLVWLGLLARDFYRSRMAGLIADEFNIVGAVAFYLIYLVGVLIFAVSPALEAGSLARAALLGAAFGFFCYATYDLTNLAVMRDYPAGLAVVDIVWGTILTAGAASAGYLAATRFA